MKGIFKLYVEDGEKTIEYKIVGGYKKEGIPIIIVDDDGILIGHKLEKDRALWEGGFTSKAEKAFNECLEGGTWEYRKKKMVRMMYEEVCNLTEGKTFTHDIGGIV